MQHLVMGRNAIPKSQTLGTRLARCTAPPAHSPPLPPSSGCLTQIQTLRIASTQALIDAVTAALPPPPLPPLPPSLHIPPPIDRRDDIPESEQPPRKRLHLSTICSRYEIGESSTARPARGQGIDYGFVSTVDAEERRQGIRDVGYGIRDTWVDPAEAVPEIAPMTVGEVNTRVVELAELHERDTQDLYALLEDAQDGRSRISQRVDMNSQRVDLLMGDRMTLQETVWMVEEEAYASREAWARSIGLSQATHQELQTHRDHVYAHETYLQAHQTQLQLQSTLIQTQHQVHETRFQMQHTELAALRETDRRRQDQMVEALRVIRDMRREMSDMQVECGTTRATEESRHQYQEARSKSPRGFWDATKCRQSLNMGHAKGMPVGGVLAQGATSAISTTMPMHPELPQCNKIVHFARDCRSTGKHNGLTLKGQRGNSLREWLFLSVDSGTRQERLSKTEE
ncbi:hypothetical protein Tco_0966931 [Tanacetum coccineum]